jgi:hypothetical protein
MAFGDLTQAVVSNQSSPTAVTSLGATLGSSPTSGNLLVTGLGVNKDSGAITAPSGFTIPSGMSQNETSVSGSIAYKISDGSETGSQDWSWVDSQRCVCWLAEYEIADTFDVAAKDPDPWSETAVTSRSTGTTATLAKAQSLAVCHWAVDTYTNVDGGRSYNPSSYTERVFVGTHDPGCWMADRVLSSTDAAECTFSTIDGGDQMFGRIVIFNEAADGGGLSIPLAINSYRQRHQYVS